MPEKPKQCDIRANSCGSRAPSALRAHRLAYVLSCACLIVASIFLFRIAWLRSDGRTEIFDWRLGVAIALAVVGILLFWRVARREPVWSPDHVEFWKRRRVMVIAAAGFLLVLGLVHFGVAAVTLRRLPAVPAGAPTLTEYWKNVRRDWQVEAASFMVVGVVCLLGTIAFVVDAYRLRGRVRRLLGHCGNCAYDLRGLTEPRCPEWGTAFDPADLEEKLPDRTATEAQPPAGDRRRG